MKGLVTQIKMVLHQHRHHAHIKNDDVRISKESVHDILEASKTEVNKLKDALKAKEAPSKKVPYLPSTKKSWRTKKENSNYRNLQSKLQDYEGKVRVVARVRPLLTKVEQDGTEIVLENGTLVS